MFNSVSILSMRAICILSAYIYKKKFYFQKYVAYRFRIVTFVPQVLYLRN